MTRRDCGGARQWYLQRSLGQVPFTVSAAKSGLYRGQCICALEVAHKIARTLLFDHLRLLGEFHAVVARCQGKAHGSGFPARAVFMPEVVHRCRQLCAVCLDKPLCALRVAQVPGALAEWLRTMPVIVHGALEQHAALPDLVERLLLCVVRCPDIGCQRKLQHARATIEIAAQHPGCVTPPCNELPAVGGIGRYEPALPMEPFVDSGNDSVQAVTLTQLHQELEVRFADHALLHGDA